MVDLTLALDPSERIPSAAALALLLRAVAAREEIILGGTVSRCLLDTMDRDGFAELLGSVHGGIGRELRTAWTLFEEHMVRVGEQSGIFSAVDEGESTQVSLSALSFFGDDDDDDEDQTIVMRIGPIDEE